MKAAMQKAGTSALKHGLNTAKQAIMKGKDLFIQKAKSFWKNYLKGQLISVGSAKLSENYCDLFFANQVDKLMNGEKAENDSALDQFIQVVDIIDAKKLGKECDKAVEKNTYVENLQCAKAVLTTLSAFDPTGLVAVAATFMHPVCEKPEAVPPINKVDYTFQIFSECFYQGETKTIIINELKNVVNFMMINIPAQSWKAGKNVYAIGVISGREVELSERRTAIIGGEQPCEPRPKNYFHILPLNLNCIMVDSRVHCEKYESFYVAPIVNVANYLIGNSNSPINVRFIHPGLEATFYVVDDSGKTESFTITKNENLYYPELTQRHGVKGQNINKITIRKINK